jgi:hypothetical protein
MDQFDHTLLTDYINGFWGYGTFSADYWFVGMEEGGGGTILMKLIREFYSGIKEAENL